MTFQTVVIPREDGDFDVIAAYNVETLAQNDKDALQLAQDFLQWEEVDKQAFIMELENVTDVIEHDLIGMEEKITVTATWNYTLDTECPKCGAFIDLADCSEVHDFILQEKSGVVVDCPKCDKQIIINMVV